MQIAATENARLLGQVRELGSADWTVATDCTRWSVRDVVVHLIASAQAQASPIRVLQQVWAGQRVDGQVPRAH